MKEETIFRMSSPYRDDFRIKAYVFGEGEKALCIVGSMRGDELQQLYVASQMVKILQEAESANQLTPGVSIAVIPSANPSSINIEKRFWALDNTDINRMFPGYDKGETTQRIAAALFGYLKDFRYGIQLASYYLPGTFLPHIRMMHTGFESTEEAGLFGFPYIDVHTPEPFDTVLLNYNWQIWNTQAFSLYAGTTDTIETYMAHVSIESICRFMRRKGFVDIQKGSDHTPEPIVLGADDFINIQAPHAGILVTDCVPGQKVKQGDVLAHILHPYLGETICNVTAPDNGIVFFARNKSITFQDTLLFRLIRNKRKEE